VLRGKGFDGCDGVWGDPNNRDTRVLELDFF
jgi:hypothetical protein